MVSSFPFNFSFLQVLSTRLGRKPEDIIKLDANENPYGPPPEVRHIMIAVGMINSCEMDIFYS